MKTRSGRPRGLTRLARSLGLDRNPLRRATDWAEAWIRVGLLAVPGDEEALQPTRHEAEQQGRLVADHLNRMRHTAGKSRVGARPHLDAGIADPRDQLPLHHVEQLVLARVGVQRRLLPGPHRPQDSAIFATGLAALHFHLDA